MEEQRLSAPAFAFHGNLALPLGDAIYMLGKKDFINHRSVRRNKQNQHKQNQTKNIYKSI